MMVIGLLDLDAVRDNGMGSGVSDGVGIVPFMASVLMQPSVRER